MKLKSAGKFVAVASLLVAFTGIGCAFGSQRGYSLGFDESSRTSDVSAYPVPSEYTSVLTPVPYTQDSSFVFDTFVFVDQQGRKVAIPVPMVR